MSSHPWGENGELRMPEWIEQAPPMHPLWPVWYFWAMAGKAALENQA